MKMIHCAQLQNCLIDQLHRIRRIPVNGRTEEQPFYIVPTIKTHGQCTYLIRAECRPLCIIANSVDTINTVIAAVICQQDLQQRNTSSVCRKAMTNTTGHCIACSHAAILPVHTGRSAGRIILGCISQNTQLLIQMTVPYRLHVLPPFQKHMFSFILAHMFAFVNTCFRKYVWIYFPECFLLLQSPDSECMACFYINKKEPKHFCPKRRILFQFFFEYSPERPLYTFIRYDVL